MRRLGDGFGLETIGALKNGPDNKSPAINSALKNFTQFEVAVLVIVDAVVLVTTVDFSNNNLGGRPTLSVSPVLFCFHSFFTIFWNL